MFVDVGKFSEYPRFMFLERTLGAVLGLAVCAASAFSPCLALAQDEPASAGSAQAEEGDEQEPAEPAPPTPPAPPNPGPPAPPSAAPPAPPGGPAIPPGVALERSKAAQSAAADKTASAGQAVEAEEDSASTFFGEWRYVYSHMQDFPLNADGQPSGLNWYLDQRLDVGVEQQVAPDLSFTAELELFYGQVDGEFDHVGAAYRLDARETLPGWDLKNAELRQLWLTWRPEWFVIRAGQMGSHWGLGVLANDGRPTPGRVGMQDQGDLSDRIIIATKPLASLFPDHWAGQIVAALGGGIVYRDENSSLRDGDVAGEALLSVFYSGEQLWTGLYVAGRFADDQAGTRLDVVALDLHARYEQPVGTCGPIGALELIYVAGKTDRVITADHLDGLNVSAFGAVARAGWQFAFWGLRSELEVGYASGDPDPHDSTVTSFSFDPDYKVGLVLFDSVMRGMTAMAAEQAADPNRVGQALPGTDQLASRGRVTNALYVFPQVRLQPIEQLHIMAAFLYAWSAVEFSQSYQTFDNGGVPTNAYGLANAGRKLGWEIDLGLDWDQPLFSNLHLVAGLQAGWFFPGSAFERPDGTRPGTVARLLSRVALTW